MSSDETVETLRRLFPTYAPIGAMLAIFAVGDLA